MTDEATDARLSALHADISSIKASMERMAEALVRLARLEEKHNSIATSLDRAFAAISKITDRLVKLEAAQPQQAMSSNIVMDCLKFAAGALVMLALKKGGIL